MSRNNEYVMESENNPLSIDTPLDELPTSEKFDSAMKLLFTAKSNLNSVILSIEDVIHSSKIDVLELQDQHKYLKKQKFILQKRAKMQEKEISGLTQEQETLLEEYKEVKLQLGKLTKLASGDENVSIQDMRVTLSIYTTLFTEVYSSEAHFKILLLLHGDSEVLDIEKLKGALGIEGAIVLRACHELHKAKLIEFDFDTKECRLVKRLFPKKK
ncbi:MAG: hypothetical protein ACTSVZ_00535 [Promethearchaeota archaeon]